MNPVQVIEKFMVGNKNPLFTNLVNMAKNGKEQDVRNFARNICKERGIDFDKEFNAFMSNFR